MSVDFLSVLITVGALILLAIPGFILKKCRALPENATRTLTTVLLYIGQPLLTFMSFQKTEYRPSILTNMLIMAGLALAVHLLMIGLVTLIFMRKKGDARVRVVKFASVFGNCGYMGLPFLQAMFPNSGEVIIYGAVIVAVFNLISWTLGIYLITGEKKYVQIKKAILNPPFIALAVSLPLFILLKQPIGTLGMDGSYVRLMFEKLTASLNLLADLVTPLSMIILGMRLAEMNVRQVFANPWVYCSSVLKLTVMPLIAFAFVALIPNLAVELRFALFFTFAMPTATQTLLFSEQFGGEPYTASSAVLLNTALSVLTIPIMSLLLLLV